MSERMNALNLEHPKGKSKGKGTLYVILQTSAVHIDKDHDEEKAEEVVKQEEAEEVVEQEEGEEEEEDQEEDNEVDETRPIPSTFEDKATGTTSPKVLHITFDDAECA